MGGDPVENGVVESLSRPGGNLTGATTIAADLFERRVALLHELVPAAQTIGYLVNSSNASFAKASWRVPLVAQALGVRVWRWARVSRRKSSKRSTRREGAGSLVVGPDTFFTAQRELLVSLAARHAMPASYFRREFVERGGLVSYSSDYAHAYHQIGQYVGRVLKGEKPADLPVVQADQVRADYQSQDCEGAGIICRRHCSRRADEVIE